MTLKLVKASRGIEIIKRSGPYRIRTGGPGLRGLAGGAGAPGSSNVVGTSASSVAIGTGSKTFAIAEEARGWGVGARLRGSSDADAANFVEGTVSSYADDSLTLAVDLTGGSGTHADWTFNLAGQPGGGREVLTANRSYYVDAGAGNDANSGLSSGAAFATIQKAINTVAALDLSIYNVTVHLADGTYAAFAANGSFVGSGTVSVVGNVSNPENVVVSGGTAVSANNGARLTISAFEVQATGFGLSAAGGFITITGPFRFGTCTTRHMSATQNGSIFATSTSYSIVGDAAIHMAAQGGVINIFNTAVTLVGSRAFSTFAYSTALGSLTAASATFSGSATGVRYGASSNSIIAVAGGGASFFPGSTAGSTSTGGQYA